MAPRGRAADGALIRLFGTVAAVVALGLGCERPAERSSDAEPHVTAPTSSALAPAPPVSLAARLPRPPRNLAASIPTPERNPLTVAGIELGRRLFFDPTLSANNQVSCATCHHPDKAFTDGEALGRAGQSGEPLRRNAPTLVNLAWHPGYFWDGGGYDLESQAFAPIKHPDEMGQNLDELLVELAARPPYLELFARAFPDGLTLPNVVRAIAQFERSLISANSRYDQHVRGEGVALTDAELDGLAVFRRHCGSCHRPDFFTDHDFHNNGLDEAYPEDHERLAWGRGRITGAEADIGRYKTPTLRNVMLTAPYMHDGRFARIEDVLAHYRSGVKRSPTLAPVLARGGRLGIPLTAADERALIAFLHTLTDLTFTTAPSHQAPPSR